jgi:hypothetical protein
MAKLYETGDFVIHPEPGRQCTIHRQAKSLTRKLPATISARMAEKADHFDLAPDFRRGVANGYLAEIVLNVSRLGFADQIRTDGLSHLLLPNHLTARATSKGSKFAAKYCLNNLKQHIQQHTCRSPLSQMRATGVGGD